MNLHWSTTGSTQWQSSALLIFSKPCRNDFRSRDPETKRRWVVHSGQVVRFTLYCVTLQGSSIYSDSARANYERLGANVFEYQIPRLPTKRLGTVEEVCALWFRSLMIVTLLFNTCLCIYVKEMCTQTLLLV